VLGGAAKCLQIGATPDGAENEAQNAHCGATFSAYLKHMFAREAAVSAGVEYE